MAEIIDALRRDGDSSNSIIGIVILVLLTVFVAPDVLPQLVSESIPFLDEGLPCTQVLSATDRAQHQSLIGRAANDALILDAEIISFPNDGTRPMVVRVIVINNTIGSVPFVFNPDQVIVGDDPNSSGIGLIFTPAITASLDYDENLVPNARIAGQTSFPNEDIRILGPRQRCVHRVEIPANQLTTIHSGGTQTQVRAYYRIQTAGTVQQLDPLATPIYGDQGLNVIRGGVIESANVPVPLTAFANDVQGQ